MRSQKMGRAILLGILASGLLMGATVQAQSTGLVFRANGLYKGEEDISADGIKCDVPGVGAAIPDGAWSMGMWNTYGARTLMFPDRNNPAADPCGVYIQLENNMALQGINVTAIEIKMRVPNSARFRDQVPIKKKWPVACRGLRSYKLWTGTRLDAAASTDQPSQSGQPNVAFVQLLPMVTPQVISCLRGQYTSLPPDLYSSLPIALAIRAVGIADNGDTVRTNTIAYTLTLRHSCGNGRVDDGEICDPAAPNTCLLGACSDEGMCGDTNVPCATDADCVGICVEPGSPTECMCVY